MKTDRVFKRAFTDSIPVMTGYLALGFGFGVVLAAKGYGAPWALGMSVFIYAGSMQFMAIDLMSGGASLLSAALTTLLVNARHLFYGLSMIEEYRHAGKVRPYLIFALTDETYSLVCHPPAELEGAARTRYFFLVSLLDQIYWVLGSVLGALFGSLVHFNSEGIDFALTALFVTVATDQWLSGKEHGAALIGLGAALVCRLLFGADSFLIPAMLVILLLLTLTQRERGRRA